MRLLKPYQLRDLVERALTACHITKEVTIIPVARLTETEEIDRSGKVMVDLLDKLKELRQEELCLMIGGEVSISPSTFNGEAGWEVIVWTETVRGRLGKIQYLGLDADEAVHIAVTHFCEEQ